MSPLLLASPIVVTLALAPLAQGGDGPGSGAPSGPSPTPPSADGSLCTLDFGVTPDDAGDAHACPGVSTLTNEYVQTLGIVFGTAVPFPGAPTPPVDVRSDSAAACAADPCRSSGAPAFATDWWCGFLGSGVSTFSASLCEVDAGGDAVADLEAYDASGALVASAFTVAGSASQTVTVSDPSNASSIAFVRVRASADPFGLSVDCLAWDPPVTPPCPTSAAVQPVTGTGNAPGSLFVLPSGATPGLANDAFAVALDLAPNACDVSPGAITSLALSPTPAVLAAPAFGCAPGAPGELLVALTPATLLFGPAVWLGPGQPDIRPLPVPNKPSLCGLTVYAQGLFVDVTPPTQLVLTNRLDLRIGLPTPPPPPTNDECAAALPIAAGLTAGGNVAATTSPTTGSCGSIDKDVWYEYVPPVTGLATASLCAAGSGADFDAVVAAFDGSCTLLTELACSDDACGTAPQITFPVVAGTATYLAVGGFQGGEGAFTLSLSVSTGPANDECAAALPITDGVTLGTNVSATNSAAAPCFALGGDVWYAYTATCTGTATVGFCAPESTAGFDTTIAAYGGTCPAPVELACDDDTCGTLSRVDFPVVAGQTYLLRVGGFSGAQGAFALGVACQ